MSPGKRPFTDISQDDNTHGSVTNDANAGLPSLSTIPSPKKLCLDTSCDSGDQHQEMGCCASTSADSRNDQPENGIRPCEPWNTEPAPLSLRQIALLPTPDPEVATELISCGPGRNQIEDYKAAIFTPSPSVETPTSSHDLDMVFAPVKSVTSDETAGSRVWKMLKEDRPDCLEQIFKDVFDVRPPVTGDKFNDAVIRPYYRSGMLTHAIRTGDRKGENDVVLVDNVIINTSAMQVNKEFRDAGSRLFYGPYTFAFHDPINAKWWGKRIGEVNLSNVRSLYIAMMDGFPNLKSVFSMCCFDQCEEESWHSFFVWLRSRHQLRKLSVDYNDWDRPGNVYPSNPDLQQDLAYWRDQLYHVLSTYRGIKEVDIIDRKRVEFNAYQRTALMLLMIQDRESVLYVPPQPKMGLAALLEHIRVERRMAESVMRRDRKRLARDRARAQHRRWEEENRAWEEYQYRNLDRFGA